MTATDNEYPKASNATLIGACITYVSGIFLLLSFAGPYWIESYPEMFSSFKHMGLWEYCFDRFRFPSYQFDKLFHGCHYIFGQILAFPCIFFLQGFLTHIGLRSSFWHLFKKFNDVIYLVSMEFYVIREWLLPGWLMAVQFFVTVAFILSLLSQVLLASVIVRWPLRTVLRYEWIFVSSAFIMVATSSVCLFFAVTIFGGNCYRRDWLLYPSFNVLSWSYAFSVVAFILFGIAAILLYLESRKLYELRSEAKNLVAQMQHSQPEHTLHQLRDQLQQQRQLGYI